MIPVLSSCLKNTFVSKGCFFYKLGGKRLNFRGQRGVGIFGFADLANFWCPARFAGFSPILSLVFDFRQQL